MIKHCRLRPPSVLVAEDMQKLIQMTLTEALSLVPRPFATLGYGLASNFLASAMAQAPLYSAAFERCGYAVR